MPRRKKTREEFEQAMLLEATPEAPEDPTVRKKRLAKRRQLRSRVKKMQRELDITLQGSAPVGISVELPVVINHQEQDNHFEESKQEEDDPDGVIARRLAREEARRVHDEYQPLGDAEELEPMLAAQLRADGLLREGANPAIVNDDDHALRVHAAGLARLHHRDEARAQVEADDEADRAAEVSERRRARRGKVRYQHALGNHVDFDASAVSGENAVGGRHRLPDPNDLCPICSAWKWPGESAIGCCVDGRVKLPPLLPAPPQLRTWFDDEDFRRQIRMYNQVCAFTSIGASCSEGFRPVGEDRSVQGQRGTYTYRIQGPMGHFMGSLLPYTHPTTGEEQAPKFAQIYVYDPDMEQRALQRRGIFDGLNEVALMDLEAIMQEFNPFAREFISMGDCMRELRRSGVDPVNITLRLRANYEAERTNGAQVVPEVAAVLVEDGNAVNHRDLVLFPQRGGLLRLFETLKIYDPTQYVLLLPFGELGWSYTDEYADGRVYRKKKTMSLRERIAYRLYQKTGDLSLLFLGGRLFQQYVVDQCAKVEQERLRWVAANQKEIRADEYAGVRDAYLNENVGELREGDALLSRYNPDTGDLEHPDQGRRRHFLDQVGQRIILPASFTGGERYMYAQYQDAMAMVREYGKPDLFMTVTCNPQWPEIDGTAKNFAHYLTAQDRPDIVARVWQQKLKAVLKDLDEGVLGYMIARIYVVEFQKRGLPHAHILIILADEDKPKTRSDYDRFVSAEVPDQLRNPHLYSTVMTSMIHGPCGESHPDAPCMKNGKCSKGFPKELCQVTQTNENSFPVYRRRLRPDGEHQFKRRVYDNATLNRWIVPYNPFFSQKYDCHINLEICSSITAIKYLYKYVYKGADTTEISAQAVRNDESLSLPGRREPNEIVRYVKARYISPIEACMRLFEFPIQGKTHSVTTLSVHLPDSQYITFQATDDPAQVVGEPKDTTLTAFFKLAASDAEAKRMLYQDIPKRFKWDKSKHQWIRYKQNRRTLGRIVHCSPSDLERFYLRLLLCHTPGPTSFEDLRTVDGVQCATFKEAAMRSGYLDDDREWMNCLQEAAVFQMPSQLRQLFATILLYAFPADVAELWSAFYTDLSLDHARRFRELPNHVDKVKFETLVSMHPLLTVGGKTLADYPDLPQLSEFPGMVLASLSENTFIRREMEGYDRSQLRTLVDTVGSLNNSQRTIYDEVIAAVDNGEPGAKLFFIDGPGGTGKSTLLNHVLAKVRLDNKIAIAVASSGIASLLLPGGRTAHSTFKIPLKPSSTSVCKIPKQSKLKAFIESASLIVWDEAPMTHRHAFEAVDRTLRDILGKPLEPFGGKVVILSGDFRQILPVVVKGTPSDIVYACLKSSELWPHFKQVHLTQNMRVQSANNEMDATELAAFSEFLLQVGEGRHNIDQDLGHDFIKLPRDLLINNPAYDPQLQTEHTDSYRPMSLGVTRVVDAMYPIEDLNDPRVATDDYYASRTILTPTNAAVQRVNEAVAERLSGNVQIYLSVDSVADNDGPAAAGFFETEFLHSVNINGIPPHKLVLKVGMPVMMLRNLNPDDGLCNGTRLRIVQLKPHVIRATIMTGAHNGKEVLIPRIIFISDNTTQDFPFHLRRKQFPIVPAFAMTINNAQGQTVHNMALYLPTSCFSHGQLYVALSRVTARNKFRALIENPASEDENGAFTANIVYREVLGAALTLLLTC